MSLSRKLAAPLALSFALVTGQAAMADDNTQAFTCDAPDMTGWSLPDRMEKIMPATVMVTTIIPEPATAGPVMPPSEAAPGNEGEDGAPQEPGPEQRFSEGIGSGFVVDPSGIIFTNHHVVDGGEKFLITFYDPNAINNTGKTIEANLLGVDEKLDLAALKVDLDGDLPCVSFGDSDTVRIGDTVNVVGNPLGIGSFSLSSGIVSNTMRNLVNPRSGQMGNALYDFVQTDAALNHGNSGGPVFDQNGKLVGVSDAIIAPRVNANIGLGLFLKANDVAEVGNELILYGEAQRAGLGVQIQDVVASTAVTMGVEEGKGVLVARTVPGKPAALSGILENDIILEFDGKEVNSSNQLVRAVSSRNPGDDVEVTVLRNGHKLTLDVNLTDRTSAVAGLSEPPVTPEEKAPEVAPVAPSAPTPSAP